MWIFCNSGFFSVVRKDPSDEMLTVRARVRKDLERFVKEANTFSPIKEHVGTDYPYRVQVYPEVFAFWLSNKGANINYGNFKSAVSRTSGRTRVRVYHRVWAETLQLEFSDQDER